MLARETDPERLRQQEMDRLFALCKPTGRKAFEGGEPEDDIEDEADDYSSDDLVEDDADQQQESVRFELEPDETEENEAPAAKPK